MVIVLINFPKEKKSYLKKIEKNVKVDNRKVFFIIKESENKVINILEFIKEFGEDNIFIIDRCLFSEENDDTHIGAYIFIDNHHEMYPKKEKPTLLLNSEKDDIEGEIISFLNSHRVSIINLPKLKLIYLLYHNKIDKFSDEEIEFLNNISYKDERIESYYNMFPISIYIKNAKKIDPRVINALKTDYNLNNVMHKYEIGGYTPLNHYCLKDEVDINILKLLITKNNTDISYRDVKTCYTNKPIKGYMLKHPNNFDEKILLCLMENLNYNIVSKHTEGMYDMSCTYITDIWGLLETQNISVSMHRKLEELRKLKKKTCIIQ